jgi:hypothetical protein
MFVPDRRGLSNPHSDRADPRQSSCAHLQGERKPGPPTPKRGSRLDLVQGFFPKPARSALRSIRVAPKQELRRGVMAAIDDVNQNPIVHTGSDRRDKAARSRSSKSLNSIELSERGGARNPTGSTPLGGQAGGAFLHPF